MQAPLADIDIAEDRLHPAERYFHLGSHGGHPLFGLKGGTACVQLTASPKPQGNDSQHARPAGPSASESPGSLHLPTPLPPPMQRMMPLVQFMLKSRGGAERVHEAGLGIHHQM